MNSSGCEPNQSRTTSQHAATETSPTYQFLPSASQSTTQQALSAEPQTSTETRSMIQPRECSLEKLPPEIRRQILCISDLPTLKSLVHASPTYHQQYLLDRQAILCSSLNETLGSVAIDAYFLDLFEAEDDPEQRDFDGLLGLYSEKLSQQRPILPTLTLEGITSISSFYLSYAHDVVKHYMASTLNHLVRVSKVAHVDQEPSRMETLRFTRAVYRFQLLCQVQNGAKRLTIPRLDAFIRIFEPWEAEEIFAFYRHVEMYYNDVFGIISWDVNPKNPVFEDQDTPNTPEGAFWLDIVCERLFYMEGAALEGLRLLQKVLNTDDHGALVKVMQENMTQSDITIDSQEGFFGMGTQVQRRRDHLSDRDKLQDSRAPLPFRGDTDTRAPSLAWTTTWKDTYSNLYGHYIDDEEIEMKWWGYIFWDARRLRDAGMVEVIEKSRDNKWECDFGGEDPRNKFYP